MLNNVPVKTKIVAVKLDNDKEIKIEATALEELIGEERIAAFGLPDFAKVSESIEAFATIILKTVQKVQPTKASIELGFDIEIDNNNNISAVLVKGSASANLKIALEWEKK